MNQMNHWHRPHFSNVGKLTFSDVPSSTVQRLELRNGFLFAYENGRFHCLQFHLIGSNEVDSTVSHLVKNSYPLRFTFWFVLFYIQLRVYPRKKPRVYRGTWFMIHLQTTRTYTTYRMPTSQKNLHHDTAVSVEHSVVVHFQFHYILKSFRTFHSAFVSFRLSFFDENK